MKISSLLPLLVLAACTPQTQEVKSGTGPASTVTTAPKAQLPVPFVDHHQHLLSEPARDVTLSWTQRWPLPAIELPGDMQRLLAKRQAAWSDKAALAALMHDRTVYLDPDGTWAVGREAAAEGLSTSFRSQYRMRPVAAASEGNSGYIAGYYERGEEASPSYVGYFNLDLVRSQGEWHIIGETTRFPGPTIEPLVDGDQLVTMLDEAGIRRSLVFSNAHYFSRAVSEQPGEYEQVKDENDWTLAQVRRHPDRLFAACSVNPLRRYAIAEIERCATSGGYEALKLHFDASRVDLGKGAHAASVRRVFETGNRLGLPLIVHLQSEDADAAEQARIFLRDILPGAPDVPVTVNHMWGGGGYGDGPAAALAVFADAFEAKQRGLHNLWFDVAQVSMAAGNEADRAEIVSRMRQIGIDRILYGSDGIEWGGVSPMEHWQEFAKQMPLSAEELTTLAANVAPYLR